MGAILLLKYGNLRLPAGNILDLYRVRISIWLGSIRSEIFLLIKFIFFQGCPITCPFYLGSPLHVISSLFSHFCLFQNANLRKITKLGFWNFKSIFLRIQFSLVATFFFSSFGYMFEVIFASYTVSWVFNIYII